MAFNKLFKPKWQHANPEVRVKAVTKIQDTNLLAKIACEDKAAEVRSAAVNNISDENILAELLGKQRFIDVIQIAINKINNLQLLVNLAIKAVDPRTRTSAVERITEIETDEEKCDNLLDNLYNEISSSHIRENIVKHLKKFDRLKEIALNDSSYDVKITAAIKLKDSRILANLLSIAILPYHYSMIIENIDDEKTLAEIALNHSEFEAREMAIKKLKDVALIEIIAKSKEEQYNKYSISDVIKLDNTMQLLDIVIYSTKRDVRFKAINCIVDPFLPGKITGRRHFLPSNVRSILIDISNTDKDKKIRECISNALARHDGLV